jgi:hypothetical protein
LSTQGTRAFFGHLCCPPPIFAVKTLCYLVHAIILCAFPHFLRVCCCSLTISSCLLTLDRLKKLNILMDPCHWVTRGQYYYKNKCANSSTFQASHGWHSSSIASFPGVSSSLTGTIGQDAVAVGCWIKLPTDQ